MTKKEIGSKMAHHSALAHGVPEGGAVTVPQVLALVQLGLCVWALLIIELSEERPRL